MLPFRQKVLCETGPQATVDAPLLLQEPLTRGAMPWDGQRRCADRRTAGDPRIAEAGGSKPAWDAETNPTALSWIPCHSQPRPAAILEEQWEPCRQCQLLSGSSSWSSAPLAPQGLLWLPGKQTSSQGPVTAWSLLAFEIIPLKYLSPERK